MVTIQFNTSTEVEILDPDNPIDGMPLYEGPVSNVGAMLVAGKYAAHVMDIETGDKIASAYVEVDTHGTVHLLAYYPDFGLAVTE